MYQDGGATCDKTAGLKITLSRTPANIGQACGLQTPVVWVRPKGCSVDTEWAAVIVKTGEDGNLNGKVLTIPDTLANYDELLDAAADAHGVCVEYFVDKPEARSVGINANFIPAELVLLLTTNLFAGDANAPETGKPVGSITVKIPRFQLDGQFDLSMAMTSAATMSLNGTALAVDNGECDGNGIYAEIVEVEQGSLTTDGLRELMIDEDCLFVGQKPIVYGVYGNGQFSEIGPEFYVTKPALTSSGKWDSSGLVTLTVYDKEIYTVSSADLPDGSGAGELPGVITKTQKAVGVPYFADQVEIKGTAS